MEKVKKFIVIFSSIVLMTIAGVTITAHFLGSHEGVMSWPMWAILGWILGVYIIRPKKR